MKHRITPAVVDDSILAPLPEGEPWDQGVFPVLPVVVPAAQTEAPPPPAAQPAPEEVAIEGSGIQKTRTFNLSRGNYTVAWTATLKGGSNSAYFGGHVQRADGTFFFETVANEVIRSRSASGQTQMYNVKPGEYYLNMNTGCDWRVTITRQ